jgi:hypothetical protein
LSLITNVVSLFLIVIYMIGADTSVQAPKESSPKEPVKMDKDSWKEQQVSFKYQNVKVPNELWDKVKQVLTKQMGKGKSLDDYALIPISLQVELTTNDPFVFKEKVNHRVIFVEGGGTLDFFDFVNGKGEFYVRLSPHLLNDNTFHLLYISDSPGKQVEGSSWGNGCGKIYNLTDSANRFIYDQGIKVTSARRHHLHLLAGTYVFFQLVDERLFLGYIRLIDSRFPQFGCH